MTVYAGTSLSRRHRTLLCDGCGFTFFGCVSSAITQRAPRGKEPQDVDVDQPFPIPYDGRGGHRAQAVVSSPHDSRHGHDTGGIWDLEALSQDCARDGAYAFLLAAQPLRFSGAVASPVNPVAIKSGCPLRS